MNTFGHCQPLPSILNLVLAVEQFPVAHRQAKLPQSNFDPGGRK